MEEALGQDLAPSEGSLEGEEDVALADRMLAGHEQVLGELRKRIIGQQPMIDRLLASPQFGVRWTEFRGQRRSRLFKYKELLT